MEIDPYVGWRVHRRRRRQRRASPLLNVGNNVVVFSLSFLGLLRIWRPPPPLPLPDDGNHDDDKRRRIRFPPPYISLPNANGGCDSSQFVTITGRSSTPPFAFHQQSSWLLSCLFPTCRHRPTPPNIAAHPPIATGRGGAISLTYHMDVLLPKDHCCQTPPRGRKAPPDAPSKQ